MQKWGKRLFSKQQLGMRGHQDSNANGVRIVTYATSKNLVKSTVVKHGNIHKYTGTSLAEMTHNQIAHILIDMRWHLSILDV